MSYNTVFRHLRNIKQNIFFNNLLQSIVSLLSSKTINSWPSIRIIFYFMIIKLISNLLLPFITNAKLNFTKKVSYSITKIPNFSIGIIYEYKTIHNPPGGKLYEWNIFNQLFSFFKGLKNKYAVSKIVALLTYIMKQQAYLTFSLRAFISGSENC